MLDIFKDEFNWMLRERKGYFPWLNNNSYRLFRHMYMRHRECEIFHHDIPVRHAIKMLLDETVLENELIDLFFKALIRAEIRFISRYIPQRSHEERLTGSLVAEIDNSIFLTKKAFYDVSMLLYKEPKQIDFLYYDLSRGGKIEKETGADLGLIFVVDLPDFPFSVKSYIFQAKKIHGNCSLDLEQYEKIKCHDDDHCDCAYLFYDMGIKSMCSPMVVHRKADPIKSHYEEAKEKMQSTFTINQDDTYSYGHPLSLFIIHHMLYDEKVGVQHSSFDDAFGYFRKIAYRKNDMIPFEGRLGIVSLGKSIQTSINSDGGLELRI